MDGAIVEACDEVLVRHDSRSMFFAAEEEVWGNIGLVCGGSLRVWIYEMDEITVRSLLGGSAPLLFTLRGTPEQGPRHLAVTPLAGDSDRSGTQLQQLPDGEWEFHEIFGRRSLFLIVGQSGFTPALAALGRLCGYEVIICEPRARFAASHGEADRVVQDSPERCIEQLDREGRLQSDAGILVCTHDRKFDTPALLAAVRTKAGFIGAMGSRKTVADRGRRLLEAGMGGEDLARIHSPVGLDLRGETPAETAVSVFAEWIALLRGGSGLPLARREGSIHGRDNE